MTQPKRPPPAQQIDGTSQNSTTMHWNSTAIAPQASSSARLIPVQGEAGQEELSAEARTATMQQKERNFSAIPRWTSFISPIFPQYKWKNSPYSPFADQGEAGQELSPEARAAAIQQREENSFVTPRWTSFTSPNFSQYKRRQCPYSHSAVSQSSSSARMQQTQYHKTNASQPSSSATSITIPEAQLTAKRERTVSGSLAKAQPSLSANRVPNQEIVQLDLQPPGAQVGATQQREVPTLYSVALPTTNAPQPSSSTRQIPVQGEVGTELLSPEAQIVAMQQNEGNNFVAPLWISNIRPISAQYLEGIHPDSPSTARSGSATSWVPNQGVVQPNLRPPGAQLVTTQQREVPTLYSTALPTTNAPQLSLSTRQIPIQREVGTKLLSREAQIVAMQQREGNRFAAPQWISHVIPISSQYTARPSSATSWVPYQGVVQPDLWLPGAQVVATQQREVPTLYSTALPTTNAPQPSSSARQIPVKREAGIELLSSKAKIVVMQQREGNCLMAPQWISHVQPVSAQYLEGIHPDSPYTARPSSATSWVPNQGVVQPALSPSGAQVVATQQMDVPTLYSAALPITNAPYLSSYIRQIPVIREVGTELFSPEAQIIAMQQREGNCFVSPQWTTARPSSSGVPNEGIVQPNLQPPGSQVVATQQRKIPTLYSTALPTTNAPQPSSFTRQIPVEREVGTELLSPKAQIVAMQQREGNCFVASHLISHVRPISAHYLEGIHPDSSSTARLSSAGVPSQGGVQPDLPPPGAQVVATQQMEVPTLYSTALPTTNAPQTSSSPKKIPVQREVGTELLSQEAQIVAIQREEGNYFVAPEWITHVKPVSTKYLKGIRPYSPSTTPQSTSSTKTEQTQCHKAYAPQQSSLAMPLAIPETQGAATRQRTATCSSPRDTLTSLINRPKQDPPLNILQSWRELVDSGAVTDLLKSISSVKDFSSIEHWTIDDYQGTLADTHKAADKLELLMYGDKTKANSSKQDSEGEKKEEKQVMTELFLGRQSKAE